jgi:hypothetical protein
MITLPSLNDDAHAAYIFAPVDSFLFSTSSAWNHMAKLTALRFTGSEFGFISVAVAGN